MELKQLEAYTRVYELQSFSKAAEEMFLSQPSISVYINTLEKELQTPLIHRSTKEFLPTKPGRLFYEYAKDMLSLRDNSIISLKNISDCAAGSIDILASSLPAQYILPEVLGAFHKLYPNLVFNIEQANTTDVVKGIAAHKGEIGFVGAKIETPKCVYENFMSEKLTIIAPYEERFKNIKSHDLAGLLRDEYFVMREAGSGTRFEYEEYLRSMGVNINELKVCAYFNDTQSIIHAVANGLGLSIVSEFAAKHYISQKMVMPIYADSLPNLPNLPKRHCYIVLKKKCVVSASVDLLIRFIRSYRSAARGKKGTE